MNFSNKVNKLFPLPSRLNEMADLILVEDLYKDYGIKSADDNNKTSTALFMLVKLPSDMPFLLK